MPAWRLGNQDLVTIQGDRNNRAQAEKSIAPSQQPVLAPQHQADLVNIDGNHFTRAAIVVQLVSEKIGVVLLAELGKHAEVKRVGQLVGAADTRLAGARQDDEDRQ